MKLIEAVHQLETLDDESTIYAAEPWNEGSEVIVEQETESGALPSEAHRLRLKYFLEVLIARDFLDGWLSTLETEPTIQQKCTRLIQYAVNDA